jgi:RimJ/RimL family protein N-acetyltransferase
MCRLLSRDPAKNKSSRRPPIRRATLACEHHILNTIIGVPHPYTTEFARMWILSHATAWEDRRSLRWAALKIGDDRIVGYAGPDRIDVERRQAELRFWVRCRVNRNSDPAEWCAAIVELALIGLNLNRLYALQLERHPLAGCVLATIGMHRERLVRKRIFKGGLVEDVVCWATLKNDWQQRSES